MSPWTTARQSSAPPPPPHEHLPTSAPTACRPRHWLKRFATLHKSCQDAWFSGMPGVDATWQRVTVKFSCSVWDSLLVSIANVDRLHDQNAWSFYDRAAKSWYPMRIAQQPMREPIITGPVAVALHQPFWGRRCQIFPTASVLQPASAVTMDHIRRGHKGKFLFEDCVLEIERWEIRAPCASLFAPRRSLSKQRTSLSRPVNVSDDDWEKPLSAGLMPLHWWIGSGCSHPIQSQTLKIRSKEMTVWLWVIHDSCVSRCVVVQSCLNTSLVWTKSSSNIEGSRDLWR